MKKFSFIFLLVFFYSLPIFANSYIDMITKKPEGYVEDNNKNNEYRRENVKPETWYDNRIAIKSPVVASKYPSYLAWARAKEQEGRHYNLRDELQRAIYTIEGIALGYGVYELYKR